MLTSRPIYSGTYSLVLLTLPSSSPTIRISGCLSRWRVTWCRLARPIPSPAIWPVRCAVKRLTAWGVTGGVS